jgi:6-phospho-3-hexuloisomerase
MNKMITICNEIQKISKGVDEAQVLEMAKKIISAKRVFLAGQGRSGLMIKGFAMRLMHLGLESYVVGESTTPSMGEGDLLLIGSGSGETGALVTMANKAKSTGGEVCLITTNPNSTIAKLSGAIIEIKAQGKGEEAKSITVQPMGSLFEQTLLVLLDSLVLYLMDLSGQDNQSMYKRHANLE